ncbi:MAG: hypothetical protein GXP10_06665, partial [Gammaproteobacteria bacterium]|nr:hypothetical protein [Gammaproteobacteria bacterium]
MKSVFTHTWTTSLLIILFSVFLTACGDSGTPPPPPSTSASINGHAVKGPVGSGTVTAYAVRNGVLDGSLQSAVTAEDGSYALSVDDATSIVVLELTGGTYTNEATGDTGNIPPVVGGGLSAVITGVESGAVLNAEITPITTMVVKRAQAMAGGLTLDNIRIANDEIWQYFFDGDNLTSTPPVDLRDTAADLQNANQPEIDYAFLLAGLTQLASNMGWADAMNLVNAFVLDGADGIFDGLQNGSAIVIDGIQLTSSSANEDLAAAITEFGDINVTININIDITIINLLNGHADVTPP